MASKLSHRRVRSNVWTVFANGQRRTVDRRSRTAFVDLARHSPRFSAPSLGLVYVSRRRFDSLADSIATMEVVDFGRAATLDF